MPGAGPSGSRSPRPCDRCHSHSGTHHKGEAGNQSGPAECSAAAQEAAQEEAHLPQVPQAAASSQAPHMQTATTAKETSADTS
jgi:Tfp pilus assembly protein PilW